MLRSVRPQKLHRDWPGSLLASDNNAAARLLGVLPVDAHVMNQRSSEHLWPLVRKDSQYHLLGRGTPFLASVRYTLADEKACKENCHHDSIRYNLLTPLIDYLCHVVRS